MAENTPKKDRSQDMLFQGKYSGRKKDQDQGIIPGKGGQKRPKEKEIPDTKTPQIHTS